MLSVHTPAPPTPSTSPTTIPSATQIVDSHLDVWTVSGGQVYENGQLTPSRGVILLLYAAGIVYQENIHHNWWLWRNGVWVATPAPLVTPTTHAPIQSALELADGHVADWTMSNDQYLDNRYSTPSHVVILLLYSLIHV